MPLIKTTLVIIALLLAINLAAKLIFGWYKRKHIKKSDIKEIIAEIYIAGVRGKDSTKEIDSAVERIYEKI